jgi:hypothetical protein
LYVVCNKLEEIEGSGCDLRGNTPGKNEENLGNRDVGSAMPGRRSDRISPGYYGGGGHHRVSAGKCVHLIRSYRSEEKFQWLFRKLIVSLVDHFNFGNESS